MKSWLECKPLNEIQPIRQLNEDEIRQMDRYIKETNPDRLQPIYRDLFGKLVIYWKNNKYFSDKQKRIIIKCFNISKNTEKKLTNNTRAADADEKYNIIANPIK